jgi:cysteinyl-tRNA synthetase
MLTLFNTLTGNKEPFRPITPGLAKIYTCGPTVYRFAHLGNLRIYLMSDWLRRALECFGYRTTHVKNITDIGHMRQEMLERGEDKVIAAARAAGKTPLEIAQYYTEAFLLDERKLNILPAHHFPRATDHVPEMIALIEQLMKKGYAYKGGDNIYYDVKAFPGYGRLSGNRLESLLQGVRIEADSSKRNPEDFTLWKSAEPGREMKWPSPWGEGFPGWHIECSAMSIKYLGETFDIHTGGVDNIFPHHEDEIAQSEGAMERRVVNYWVHGQHLLADGLKMAKSTGNAYTLADIEKRGYDPLAFRYLCLGAHYRSRLNFTMTALKGAQVRLIKLRKIAALLAHETGGVSSHGPGCVTWENEFRQAVADDLALPRALTTLWRMLKTELPPEEKLWVLLE